LYRMNRLPGSEGPQMLDPAGCGGLPPFAEGRMVFLLDHPHDVLDRSQGHEGLQVGFLIRRERATAAVAREEPPAQSGISRMIPEYLQWDGQIIEPVAITAVIEVDDAHTAPAEQDVAVVQIGMDQPESLRSLS